MKHLKSTALAMVLVIGISANSQIQDTGNHNLFVQINGIKRTDGVMRAFLFDSSENFLKEPYRITEVLLQGTDNVVAVFNEIPSGTYSVNIYHDINSNDKLDTNWMRIPKEPYGFSNNVRGKMGPPAFKDTQFVLDGSKKTITINLK